jgi:hypothetical protein
MTTPSEGHATPKGSGAPNKRATWSQTVELVGDDLVAFVKRLATDSQVRKIRIIEPDGDIMVEMPLTLGAIAGGAVVLAAPLLAILAAVAAFVAKVRLEIIRVGEPPADHQA